MFYSRRNGLPVGPEGAMINMGALIVHDGFATLGMTVDPNQTAQTTTKIQVNPIWVMGVVLLGMLLEQQVLRSQVKNKALHLIL